MEKNKEFFGNAKMDKDKEFIGNAKIEQLTEEDLDQVAGGAGTMYYGKPFVNDYGNLVVDTVYVSGTATYDPNTKRISHGTDGFSSGMSISVEKINDYIATQQGRGNAVISLDIAGKLR